MTFFDAVFRYFGSANASTGNTRCGRDAFVRFAWTVSTATPVTSDPVPQVVGIVTTGSAFVCAALSYRYSASFSGLASIIAIAFAASIGEPPPIAITKSTPFLFPNSVAFITVSTEGFSSIPSYCTCFFPYASSAASTSASAPFARAEYFPVTISA